MVRWRAYIVRMLAICAVTLLLFTGCGPSSGSKGEASGADFTQPASIQANEFSGSGTAQGPSCAIDTSHVDQGYVGAKGTSSARLKLQVIKGDSSYNYDIPADGSAMFAPINMGNGRYTFRIMQNTSGSNYVEICSTSMNVSLASEFAPFLHPNVFCNFSDSSESTKTARQLTSSCKNQGEALREICSYVKNNIKYDKAKAEELSTKTGYVPNPDSTLQSKTGICFDYASLGAAMLRAVGIPAKVITGYVSPNNLYHAWIMVYVDGTWQTVEFKINPNDWSRVDLTFAASSSGNQFVGDGKSYADRYVY